MLERRQEMSEWIVTTIQQIFDNFILGLIYLVGFFGIILVVGIIADELERRKH